MKMKKVIAGLRTKKLKREHMNQTAEMDLTILTTEKRKIAEDSNLFHQYRSY